LRLKGIEEVYEADELRVLTDSVFECVLALPHLHQSLDDPFGFSVGLRPIDARKLLGDTMLLEGFYKGVLFSSTIDHHK